MRKWRAIGFIFAALSIVLFLVFLSFLFGLDTQVGSVNFAINQSTELARIPLTVGALFLVIAVIGLASSRKIRTDSPMPECEGNTTIGRKLQITGFIFYALGVFMLISGLSFSYYSSIKAATQIITEQNVFLSSIISWIISSVVCFVIAFGVYLIGSKSSKC